LQNAEHEEVDVSDFRVLLEDVLRQEGEHVVLVSVDGIIGKGMVLTVKRDFAITLLRSWHRLSKVERVASLAHVIVSVIVAPLRQALAATH
jgi:hypothetical protein